MCEPTTIISGITLATSVAASAASVVSQNQQADAQAIYQSELAASRNNQLALEFQEARTKQAADAEADSRNLQAGLDASKVAKSTATVSAGEAGVSGVSVEALLRDFDVSEGKLVESVNRQAELRSGAVAGSFTTGLARTTAANTPQSIAGANLGVAGLQILGAGTGIAGQNVRAGKTIFGNTPKLKTLK